MEKLKSMDKKVLAIIGVVAVAVVLCLVFILGGGYKKAVKQFAKAMTDEDKMDKFVEKYVDLKAIYAMDEVMKDDDVDKDDGKEVAKAFKKEYKKAKKDDYEDYEDSAKTTFGYFVMDDDDVKIKVKKIGKLEKYDENEAFKKAKVTLEMKKDDDEEEDSMYFIFYKGKVVGFESANDDDE